MSNNILKTIVETKRIFVNERAGYYDNLKKCLEATKHTRYSVFKKALTKPGQVNLIAEVKKASPSKGIIRDDFNSGDIARSYATAGAAALSVLTEENFFQGKAMYLKHISADAHIPTLMKDFFIDERQLFEAHYCGASAVLLIVAILSDEAIKGFIKSAEDLDLDCLVEVHSEDELRRAIDCGAQIIGVNNRNLETFEVSLDISEKLVPMLPKGCVKVSESGIKTYEDVCRLNDMGVDAVLIGETFMKERNIEAKVKEVMYGQS